MSAADKIKNAAQDVTGKAKEAAGKVTDSEELHAQGKADQTEADAKKAGENALGVGNTGGIDSRSSWQPSACRYSPAPGRAPSTPASRLGRPRRPSHHRPL